MCLIWPAAKGTLRDESDIAFLTEYDIDSYECFIKAQELADIFKREVDLINLNTSSTVFKAQVIGTGKRIYCSDDTKRMFFEMRALKSYAMLNKNNILDDKLTKKMKSMEGFRNIAIHDYKAISMKIIEAIIENHIKDFE